jgi:GTP-binding protein HflX
VHSNQKHKEKAILVGVEIPNLALPIKEYLDELEQLALTAGAESVKRFTQKMEFPHPKTYVGKGKMEER